MEFALVESRIAWSETGSARTRQARLALVAGATLALIVFALLPTLSAGLVWDDRGDVFENPAATPAGFVAAIGTTNRPLLKATYAIQRGWTGSDARPFHLVNLLLHLATTVVVAALVRRALPANDRAGATYLAWGAAALWALHPAAVEAVAPISGRSVLLSTALLLVALLLATRPEAPKGLEAIAVTLCAFGAPLAKETALVLPALLALWQATLGAGEPRDRALRRWRPLLFGWAAALAALAASDRHRELVAFSLAERSPLEALRGNVHAVAELAGLWLVPSRLSIDPAGPVERAWVSFATLTTLGVIGTVALVALAVRRRHPALAFGLGWTLLALVPSNSVIWRIDPVAPRALYLASIGPMLLLALGACRFLTLSREAHDVPRRRFARRTGAVLLAGCFGALVLSWTAATRSRAALFSDPVALWADAARKSPDRARPWLNLGVALMLADRVDEAETALVASNRLDPLEARTACALDALRIRRSASRFDPERRNSP